MSDLSGTFGKPFKYQVAAFRLRLAELRDTATWKDVWQSAHDRAFMVAGATGADLLGDLAAAVDKAVSQGTTLEEFRRDFRRIVAERGWHGWTGEGSAKGEAWRTRVIYNTNLSVSYHAGRHAQLVEAGYPLWVYFHGNAREPRLQHLGWDGLILPVDHPFWATHYPPNGWGCTCYVSGARTMAGAIRLGGKPGVTLPDDWATLDPRTGAPKGVGKGWAYAPGRSVAQDVADIAARTAARVPPAIGTDLIARNQAAIDTAWTQWIDRQVQEGTQSEPGLLGALSHDVVAALAARGIEPASSEIMVRPGLVAGVKAAGPARAGDALSGAEWRALPLRLRTPDAVLRDERTGRLIYVLPSDGGPEEKLALTLDTRTRADSQATFANMVVAAARQPRPGLLSRLVGGLVSLILGSLD